MPAPSLRARSARSFLLGLAASSLALGGVLIAAPSANASLIPTPTATPTASAAPTAAPVPTPTPTAAPDPVDDTCFDVVEPSPSATTTEPVGTTEAAPGGLVVHLEPLTLRDCVVSGEIRVVATATLDNDGDYTPPTSRWYDLAEFVDGGDIPLAVPAGSYFVFAEYIARAEGEPDLEHSFYVHYVDGNPASFVVPPAPAATPAPVDDTCFDVVGLSPSAATTEPVGTTEAAPGGLVVHLEPLTLRDCVVSGEIRVVATATLDNDGDYTPPTSRWYDLAEFVDGGDIPLAVPAGSYFVFAEYIARAEGEPDLEHSFYVHYVDGNPASFVVPPAPAATTPTAHPAATTSGARLARTGADASAPLLGAGVLLATGAALLIGRRRAARA
ncbi:hypothetical protein GRS96_01545 [Rathayibacter sp. VKM Ac-2803]|uniref:LPXTG cell wall anchor domain-containing protein n=1 Tax=Rathayibacter sp. VKM Ac-2803 TaxID=2609256 RepID=UPI00135B96F9|nr:LPXTG cell wall anchor domain-containing protein [Rathayibacter sp. VKM Ac-2803]MWV47955.1 hypothetical protein [Rathayibacter sp. VKM Ac-2803]